MDNRRRLRFIAYFKDHLKASRERLMTETGLTKGRVSQLFDKSKPFGEVAARNMAEALHLAPDYFEHDRFDEDTIAFAMEYQKLNQVERNKLRRLYEVARDGADVPQAEKVWDGIDRRRNVERRRTVIEMTKRVGRGRS